MPNGSNSAAIRASGRTKRGQHSQSIEPSRPTKAAYLQSPNLLGNERARVLGTRANLRAKEKVELTVRLAKSRCEQALEALGWHATRTPDRRQDYFPKNELPANVPPERSVPGSARMCLDVWYWPNSAHLGGATSRQLSGVHRLWLNVAATTALGPLLQSSAAVQDSSSRGISPRGAQGRGEIIAVDCKTSWVDRGV